MSLLASEARVQRRKRGERAGEREEGGGMRGRKRTREKRRECHAREEGESVVWKETGG